MFGQRMGNARWYIEGWFRLMSILFLYQMYTFVNISTRGSSALWLVRPSDRLLAQLKYSWVMWE